MDSIKCQEVPQAMNELDNWRTNPSAVTEFVRMTLDDECDIQSMVKQPDCVLTKHFLKFPRKDPTYMCDPVGGMGYGYDTYDIVLRKCLELADSADASDQLFWDLGEFA